jgi:quinol monooxygenase YgiN
LGHHGNLPTCYDRPPGAHACPGTAIQPTKLCATSVSACKVANGTAQAKITMIIVTGDITTRPEVTSEAIALSLAHVRRSRLEAGCLSHDVAVDAGQPCRLLFTERWTDLEALHAHFAVPATRAFGKALGGFAASPPSIQVYQADETRPI